MQPELQKSRGGRPNGRKTAAIYKDSQVKALLRRKARMVRVSDNLYLDGKAWRLMWQRRGVKRRKHTLGYYPTMSLAQAREAASVAMGKILSGRAPGVAAVHTIQTMAPDYLRKLAAEVKPSVYNGHVGRLKNYVFPKIGGTALTQLTISDTRSVLDPVWYSNPHVGKDIQLLVKNMIAYAKMAGWCAAETVDLWRWEDNLEMLYPSASQLMAAKRQQRPSIHWQYMYQFWQDLRTFPRTHTKIPPLAYLCLQLLILTGTRANETIGNREIGDPNQGAGWDEFDLDKRIWMIPAKRMKEGKDHFVPLNDLMVAVLAQIPRNGKYLFRMPDGQRLDYVHVAAALKQVMTETQVYYDRHTGKRASLHGFRATLGTYAEEHGFAAALIDICLAHQVKSDVTGAYQRSDQHGPRAQLYNSYATFLDTGVAQQPQR